jgi:hypothetical protein
MAYLLLKHKAPLDKLRPILPCFNDPARLLSNRAARALALLIGRRWGRWQTFVLETADGLVADLADISVLAQQFAARRGGAHAMLGVSGDVKDMFTRLPHHALREFIRDMLDWMAASPRRRRIAVKHRGHGARSAFFGDQPEKGRYTEFTPETLWVALDFDLTCFFFLGGAFVLKQREGGPMGRPSTPMIAIGYTAWREHQWLQSLHHGRRALSAHEVVRARPRADGETAWFVPCGGAALCRRRQHLCHLPP